MAKVIAPFPDPAALDAIAHPVTDAGTDNQTRNKSPRQRGVHIPHAKGQIEALVSGGLLSACAQQETTLDVSTPIRQTETDIAAYHFSPSGLGLPGDHTFSAPELPDLFKQLWKVKAQVTALEFDQPLLFGHPEIALDAACTRSRVVSGHIHAIEVSPDRKSTRLNSSHVRISYAVFCLKKK